MTAETFDAIVVDEDEPLDGFFELRYGAATLLSADGDL